MSISQTDEKESEKKKAEAVVMSFDDIDSALGLALKDLGEF